MSKTPRNPSRKSSAESGTLSGQKPTVNANSSIRKVRKSSSDPADENHVNVVVRCRPLIEKEISDGYSSIVEFEGDKRIVVHYPGETPSDQLGTRSGERKNYSHVYDFDGVFAPSATQTDIYDKCCRPIVESVLEGYNGTIFAYGQTGTGKTFTMGGPIEPKAKSKGKKSRVVGGVRTTSGSKLTNAKAEEMAKSVQQTVVSAADNRPSEESINKKNDEENHHSQGGLDPSMGIISRAFRQIFDHIAQSSQVQFLIRASYLEIYQEEIHDLLRTDRSIKLELHEKQDTGVYVKDLTSFVCKSIGEVERVMRVGNQNRMVGATDMNEHSSRSHAIFMVTVEQQQQQQQQQQQTSTDANKNGISDKQQERVIRMGKLNLVDLAGSERQRKTNSFGQRQRESIKINLSLSALGNVINSLMKMSNTTNYGNQKQQQSNNNINQFVPYRDSILTRILQDSLGGNAKTLMIANIGPASYNYDESINTLNYASRAKRIINRPKLNEDPKDALLRELQREIDDLRAKLAAINVKKEKRKSNGNQDLQVARIITKNDEKELMELRQKLSSLEGKLLNGGNDDEMSISSMNLKGYTERQQVELERKRLELKDQEGREEAIKNELEKKEEDELVAKKSFSSIQQEVEGKKKLIRQILERVKSIQRETRETQKARGLELDDLDQLQFILQKELKLKCLIMDNFVPNAHVDQLLPRLHYDERRNCCIVQPASLRLADAKSDRRVALTSDDRESKATKTASRLTASVDRPRSEMERIGATIYPQNIRYKSENLIEPQLDVSLTVASGESTRRSLLTLDVDVDGRNRRDQTGRPEKQSNGIQRLIDDALGEREQDVQV